MKVPQILIDIVESQINALELKKFEISFINYESGKKMSDIYTQSTFLKEEKNNGILHCGIERALYMNTYRQENVYLRAIPRIGFHNEIPVDHDIVLLDDIKQDGLEYIIKKFKIACVTETSLDNNMPNMQVFLKLSEKYDCDSRKCVERALIYDLKNHGLYADSGAADGQHLARLVGFKNHGFVEKKERNHIVRLVSASSDRLAPDTTSDLIALGKTLPAFKNDNFHAVTMDEITSRPYDRPSIIGHFSELLPTVKKDANPSDIDFYLMMRLARCQYSASDICRVIAERGPNDIHRKNDAADYLSRSVSKALDKVFQIHTKAPQGRQGGRVVSSAPAGAAAPAPGSLPTEYAATPARPIRKLKMGVKPRNISIDPERSTIERDRALQDHECESMR